MIANLPVMNRTYLDPIANNTVGCCCQVTRASEHTYPNGTVRRVAEMVLQDHNQTLIPLGRIHRNLEDSHLALHQSGSSNICLSRIGFNCQVNLIGGGIVTRYFSFDLKIPLDNSTQGVFSADMLTHSRAHGSKQTLYNAIQPYNTLGRAISNPGNARHGNQPIYNLALVPRGPYPNDSYILHSEQMLVGYLDLPDAATMLKNRLITHIRGEFSNASSAIIHAIGIHLNQTKTCCGACEYSLVGLMQRQGQGQRGLIPNLITACNTPNPTLALQMNVPVNPALFPMVTTITAKENDATHRTLPLFNNVVQAFQQPPMRTIINLAAPVTSQRIFTSILTPYNAANIPVTPSQNDGSIAISGSLATAGTAGTIQATLRQKDLSLDHSLAGIQRLFA